MSDVEFVPMAGYLVPGFFPISLQGYRILKLSLLLGWEERQALALLLAIGPLRDAQKKKSIKNQLSGFGPRVHNPDN